MQQQVVLAKMLLKLLIGEIKMSMFAATASIDCTDSLYLSFLIIPVAIARAPWYIGGETTSFNRNRSCPVSVEGVSTMCQAGVCL